MIDVVNDFTPLFVKGSKSYSTCGAKQETEKLIKFGAMEVGATNRAPRVIFKNQQLDYTYILKYSYNARKY